MRFCIFGFDETYPRSGWAGEGNSFFVQLVFKNDQLRHEMSLKALLLDTVNIRFSSIAALRATHSC
jgi:hypothetical protein